MKINPRKKTFKKKPVYKKKQSKAVVPRNLNTVVAGQGFPKKMIMTHKYSELYNLSSVLGAQTNHNIRCNGMYDPFASGAGHQPMYFDQMSALYNHYTVIGSKITYTISSDSITQGGAVCSFYINDDTTVVPSIVSGASLEQSSSRYLFIPAGCNDNYKRTMKWSARKTFGISAFVGKDPYKGTSVSDPSEQSVFTLSFTGTNVNTVYLTVHVLVEYIAVWTELKDIVGS